MSAWVMLHRFHGVSGQHRARGRGCSACACRVMVGINGCAGMPLCSPVLQVATGGEDAYFISPAGHGAVGVSDGVSAWAEDGIDPGEYSRTLVQHCAGKESTAMMRGGYGCCFQPGT